MKKPAKPANKPLKIALVCDDSLDKQDGVQQYVLTLGTWLTAQGHDVHYISSDTERTDLPNLHVLSRNVQLKFNGNRLGSPLPARPARVRELLERENFDILHIQAPYSPLLAGQIVQFAPRSTAIVGTFHIFPDSPLVAIGTKTLGLFLARQLHRFHVMMSVSQSAHDFCLESFGVRSRIVPNMVDVARFSATKQYSALAEPLQIVFLGRLVERKGAQHLLRAVKAMQNKSDLPNYHVSIGGKGPLKSELEAYASEHNLTSVVSFDGFIPETEKVAYLAQADLAVFPSTGGESFGISLIEAMAASRGVVLAGDNPGYRCVMGNREEQLLQPTNPAHFSNVLTDFLTSRDRRDAAHAWQKEHVKQYDMHVVGQAVLETYHDALRNAHA